MINRKSIVNSPDDRLRQFNRMPIPSTYTDRHTHTHTLTHTHTHSHTHAHAHTHTHTRTHSHTRTHTHTRARAHARANNTFVTLMYGGVGRGSRCRRDRTQY